MGHVTYFWNIGTPSISWEWLEIETSNLARRFITIGTDETNAKLGERGSENVNVKPQFLDPQKSETPEPIDIKLDRIEYVGDLTPHSNFAISTLKGGEGAYMWNCHHPCLFCYTPLLFYFLAHLHRSHRLTDFRVLWLKRRDSAKSTSFSGCEQKILIFSTIFRKTTRNSLFPQCKTSIGNNSASIKDRDVKFAYNRGFSATADRMVWPQSLSRDRKWRH